MKKIIYSLSLVAAMVGLSACNGSGNGGEVDSPKEEMLKKAMTPYVDNTVVATYCGMADAAISLYDQCEVIMQKYEAGTLAETDIKTAAGYWEQARSYWELSEAFLYGPAANHNIDPHIDSWPLDKDGMDAMLGNAEQMAQIEEQGADYVGDKLGYGLLGFHAVEYMLYANDNTDRQNLRYHTTDYKRAEVVYLVAIAEDLRNQAVALETAWAGIDNVSATKQAILEEAEIDYGVEFVKGYGSYMKVATGGTYANYQEAAEELIQGCIDIADEVGNVKIGRPATATTEEDRNYIESPYSLNSIVDFMENIVSIKNAYTGSKSGDASVSDYIKTVDADLDAECRAAIDAAYDAIKVIPEPFAVSAKTSEAANAVKVVGTDLVEVLQKVYNKLGE
ncbi:MAG: hypothetical protein IJ000_04470 [Paludibacteraceae bacterium]|nr:hypothetical protein [Paludibacteraceae bacterium]